MTDCVRFDVEAGPPQGPINNWRHSLAVRKAPTLRPCVPLLHPIHPRGPLPFSDHRGDPPPGGPCAVERHQLSMERHSMEASPPGHMTNLSIPGPHFYLGLLRPEGMPLDISYYMRTRLTLKNLFQGAEKFTPGKARVCLLFMQLLPPLLTQLSPSTE